MVDFDWHGKMTAKVAWKLGYISEEEFRVIKREHGCVKKAERLKEA